MTTVGTMGGMDPLKKVPTESLTAKEKKPDVAGALVNNQSEVKTPQAQQQLNPNDLDYSNFVKNDRARAADKVRDSLDRVNGEVREHNRDFPANPYILDTSTFPNPANYTKARYGNKDEAFHAWKADVEIWKNDRLDELEKAETKGEEAMHNQQMQAIYQLWGQFGVTQQMLNNYCQITNQNLFNLGNITVQKANEIIAVVNNNTGYITNELNQATGFLADEIHNAKDSVISNAYQDEAWGSPGWGEGVTPPAVAVPTDGNLPENGCDPTDWEDDSGPTATEQLPENGVESPTDWQHTEEDYSGPTVEGYRYPRQ